MIVVPDEFPPLVGLLCETIGLVIESRRLVVPDVLRQVPGFCEQGGLEGGEVTNGTGEGRAPIEVRQGGLDLSQFCGRKEEVVVHKAEPAGIVRGLERLADGEEFRSGAREVLAPRVVEEDEPPQVRKHPSQFGIRRKASHPAFVNPFLETFALKLSAILEDHSVTCAKAAPGNCQHV